MSLVGPRPALRREVDEFPAELHARHDVRPGITGLWQVEARDNPAFDAYQRLDLHYVENWSLALDLVILLATVEQLLMRPFASKQPGEMARADDAPVDVAHRRYAHASPPEAPCRGERHVAQARDRSTARSHAAWAASAVVRSAAGSNDGVELPLRGDGVEVRQHAFGQGGQVRRADGRRLSFGGPLHGHAELIGLELQQPVHHRRTTVDPQLGQRPPAGPHHRLDGIAGLERHRLDDGPGEVGAGRAAGDPDDRAAGVGVPPRRAEPGERRDDEHAAAVRRRVAASGPISRRVGDDRRARRAATGSPNRWRRSPPRGRRRRCRRRASRRPSSACPRPAVGRSRRR